MDITLIKENLAKCKTEAEVAILKASLLGKKSELSSLMEELKQAKKEDKASLGKKINELKSTYEYLVQERLAEIEEEKIQNTFKQERIDISLPSYGIKRGSKHPLQIIIDDLSEFFIGMGYTIAEDREVDTDHYNFELLNIPKDHPARNMQDSFFIDMNMLLRSHTSAAQAHVMEEAQGKGPIKVICPGKVYRRDYDDRTHSHQFMQCEGLVISEDCNLSSLMQTLTLMLKHLFGENRKVRFRPSYFPFTEPSIEVDVSCFECGGKGCDLCKHTGWIEILGGGMVHPNVLRLNGFDDKKYQGFAFGVGIERLAMLKYGVDDIRKFYMDDVDFLHEFKKED